MTASNYPPGTENDPNAPWNYVEPKLVGCPVCGGTGDLDIINEEELMEGEEEIPIYEKCYKCEGTGLIEIEL